MAITDYKEPAPVISSDSIQVTKWGVTYDVLVNMQTSPSIASATKVSRWYYTAASVDYEATLIHVVLVLAESGHTMRAQSNCVSWGGLGSGSYLYTVENPAWYRLQTPARIALSVAHHECGIAEADIDTASFATVHTWADGNSLYRTVAFHEKSVIDILKELFEQSSHVYLYVNGAHQLACDYVPHEPSDTPDWTIDSDNYIRIMRFGAIRDRKVPGKIKTFYRARQVTPGSPKFGAYQHDNPGATFAEKEQIMSNDYLAHYIDDVTDYGSYINWTDYLMAQVEVKAIGHLMDIGETFKLDEASLGMSIDSSYLDNFVIHEIDLSLDGMSAIITGIKKTNWNHP